MKRSIEDIGGGAAPAPTSLSGLDDVDISAMVDGDILTYDDASAMWMNSPPNLINLDGGRPDSTYGGIAAIVAGTP